MVSEVVWIVAILFFLILEALTSVVVCIWFAGGGVIALVAGILGADIKIQIFLFLTMMKTLF